MLADEDGQIADAHSISAGLDYPGVGPEHAFLRDSGRARYVGTTDEEALDAFRRLTRTEGIIPALEPSHALARVDELDAELIVLCLSGRGDKDLAEVLGPVRTDVRAGARPRVLRRARRAANGRGSRTGARRRRASRCTSRELRRFVERGRSRARRRRRPGPLHDRARDGSAREVVVADISAEDSSSSTGERVAEAGLEEHVRRARRSQTSPTSPRFADDELRRGRSATAARSATSSTGREAGLAELRARHESQAATSWCR